MLIAKNVQNDELCVLASFKRQFMNARGELKEHIFLQQETDELVQLIRVCIGFCSISALGILEMVTLITGDKVFVYSKVINIEIEGFVFQMITWSPLQSYFHLH